MVYSLVLFVPLLSLYQELWSFFKHGGPLILAIQIWPRIGKTWPESQSLSPCGSIPFFAESNVANERSSANEGDEGSESNERSVYRSQAIKAIKAMKTPLKLVDVFFMFCLA